MSRTDSSTQGADEYRRMSWDADAAEREKIPEWPMWLVVATIGALLYLLLQI